MVLGKVGRKTIHKELGYSMTEQVRYRRLRKKRKKQYQKLKTMKRMVIN